MRDDQVRRYARHILVPDIGGLGQTALLSSGVSIAVPADDREASLIAAQFLAAGGVGHIHIEGITDAERDALLARGPDSAFITAPAGTLEADSDAPKLGLDAQPPWWPSAPGDTLALAYWRGSIAATRRMATIANG